MQLKRGWWRINSDVYRLAGELDGRWYGHLRGAMYPAVWTPATFEENEISATYLGDGPEPVEPEDKPDATNCELTKLRKCYTEAVSTVGKKIGEISTLKETIGERDAEIERLKRLVDNRESLIEQTHDDLVKALSRLE